MLQSLRLFWSKSPDKLDLGPMKAWAAARGMDFRPVRDGGGCLVEPRAAQPSWRIEWGQSQRGYMPGLELRIIGELGTPKELMAMVLTKPLMAAIEKQVFEQYVEDVQTRADTEAPPEMRWLVMYTKLTGQELGRLRERFGAVSNLPPWLMQWLAGALNDGLVGAADGTPADEAMVMTIQRGRLTLRTPMQAIEIKRVVLWLSVFERAMSEARRLGREWVDAADSGRSTMPAAWPKSALPENQGA